MFAVIVSGGKQHKVHEGDILKLEKLAVDEGASISFDNVLMLGNGDDIKVGHPNLDNVSVTAEVTKQGRGEKIKIMNLQLILPLHHYFIFEYEHKFKLSIRHILISYDTCWVDFSYLERFREQKMLNKEE